MPTPARQKTDLLGPVLVAALVAAALILSLMVPAAMPWSFLAPAGLALLLYTAVAGEVTAWTWAWVLSYGLLNGPFGRVEIAGFFNMTIPRLLFVTAVVAFGMRFLLERRGLRLDSPTWWAFVALAAICALSASTTGWLAETAQVRTAPYFRFVGSIVMPAIMFLLLYSAMRSPQQIPWFLIPLTLYGWYALYIGYLQYAAIMGVEGARSLIFPAYINNPDYGIHFDRARGAFAAAGPQSMLLVVLFYADLYLIRKVRGPYRTALIVQALLVPPAIFFTGLRSAYLGFALCGVLWCLAAARPRLGGVKLATAGVAVLLAAATFWGNLSSTRRETGGVAQVQPVLSRVTLLHQTWEIFKERPIAGVGFGHFVDAQMNLRRDPGSVEAISSGVLAQHNLFLSMAAETGIIGLIATVAVFVLIWRRSRRLWRQVPGESEGWLDRSFLVLFWVALLNHLTASMFRDMLWDVFANGLFWSFAGLVAGLTWNDSQHSQPPPAEGK